MTSKDDQKVLMAKIGAAHGIRGEVRVKPYGDDPLSFADYGILTTRDGKRSFEVERARVQKTVVITKFKGIADRNQAEELNGVDLFIDRDQLPEPEEDEFYYSDLTGLDVLDQTGETLGKIIAVQDFGAGDLLEVRPKRGRSFYVPFTKEFVPEIDLENGRVSASLPEDYFSEGAPEPSEDEPDR
ncbi:MULTISPECIES: ribosome maturation factor RimM [Stappiaceae]|jgi:16S rRNA processing protein RimM|uniref:ribosome maturation factor RimM n=1 Tax=Stappiaceae TaxID=2821832 RepID=UPI0003B81CFD|nr:MULTISPECIES: ribosome maturation factor RimM [Stappiaceae]MCR9283779.1 ribosome maturation factor RimM [Paracoccaceae bacterium]MEE2868533.1 ribosome maturation factor RimM [Pseudomonadota bacterium]AMN51257.1 ribosome maturation factor RimM [Labrenzia sp. CP4]ERP87383.1 16S rRNA-processing protein RimM [Labrenzia sp. C1B10]ERS07687.1 16S rRNA-processing protein RimM [Labrenzia sp. C1B70]